MKRHRRLRGRKLRKQRRIILASIIGITLLMTAGYAAFGTNIEISATGNVNGETASEKLKKLVITSGDGLYKDIYETDRYIYRGDNPNNYITFNSEEAGWRIVSIESDGTMKIVRNSDLTYAPWDAKGTRDASTSTYCTNASYYGCNAWTATSNLIGTPSEFKLFEPNGNSSTDTTNYSGAVVKDASLNTFLNGDYYTNSSSNPSYLGTDKQYIVSHSFYVGTPGNYQDTESIELDGQQEKSYVWNGNVGLIQATDYLKASTDTACTSLKAAYDSPYPCGNGNYLKPSRYYWTISPYVNSTRSYVWIVLSSGGLDANYAFTSYYGVRPAVYLKSDITLSGKGTEQQPYKIVEQ